MFAAVKDRLVSTAARAHVNALIKPYGRVDDLVIDSKAGRIAVVCRLDGEVDRIAVCIEKYQLAREGPTTYIQIEDCTSSRAWLQTAMRTHLVGRRWELPKWAVAAL